MRKKRFYYFVVIDYDDNSRIIYEMDTMPLMIKFCKYIYQYLFYDVSGVGCYDYDTERKKVMDDTEYCFYRADVDLPKIDSDSQIDYKELYFELPKVC